MAEMKIGQTQKGGIPAAHSDEVGRFPKKYFSDTNMVFLENNWRKTMGAKGELFFGTTLAEQNRLFVLFTEEADKFSIPRLETLKFIHKMQYKHRIENPQEMGKGQLPCLIFVSNGPSAHRVFNNGVKYAEGGTLYNGTFTLASVSSNLEEAKSNQDFQAIYYILNHNAHESEKSGKDYLPPYIIVCTQCRGGDEKSFLEAAKLSLARQDKLREEVIRAGYPVQGYSWKFPVGKKNADIFMLPAVHDVKKRIFYIVEKENGEIRKTEFEEWCVKKGISNHPIVKKHLENLRLHAQDEYYERALEIAFASAIVECVDSRRFPELTATTYRLIGSIPSDEEFLKIAKTPAEEMELVIHVQCGYINTAVAIHKMFDEVLKATNKKRIARKRISDALNDILDGKSPRMNVQAVLNEIEGLSEKSEATFRKLFGETDDSMRSVLRHMNERGLFEMKDGKYPLPLMPAVDKVSAALETAADKPEGIESLLIHEEIAKQLENRLSTLLQTHEQEISKVRGGGSPLKIRVTMGGLNTARKWLLPDKISEDLTRTDAILKEILPTELMQKEL